MTIHEVREILFGCICFNYAVLFVWFGVFVLAHDWMYGMHSRWFRLSAETFDAVHYAGLAAYKLGILLFNLAPWIVLCVVS